MSDFGAMVSSLLVAILGLTIISVILSKGAQTSGAISTLTSGFASLVQTAVTASPTSATVTIGPLSIS